MTKEGARKLQDDIGNRGDLCLVINPNYFDLEKMTQIPDFFWTSNDFFKVRVTFNTVTKNSWRVLEMRELDE